MTGDKKRAAEVAALARLLESHGADRTRWPAPERLRFAALLKGDAEAGRLLAEAAALDRLLDMAPRVAAGREAALAERIMAGAAASRQLAGEAGASGASRTAGSASATVAPVSGGVTGLAPVRGLGRAHMPSMTHGLARQWRRFGGGNLVRGNWPAAGLLAASLFIGILTGGSGLLVPALQNLPGVGASENDTDSLHLALGADRSIGADEDTL